MLEPPVRLIESHPSGLAEASFSEGSTLGDYRSEGNVWSMDFSILRDERLVAQISKAWFAWSDTYGVDIADDEDAPLMLALVIVIDQILHENKNNS